MSLAFLNTLVVGGQVWLMVIKIEALVTQIKLPHAGLGSWGRASRRLASLEFLSQRIYTLCTSEESGGKASILFSYYS